MIADQRTPAAAADSVGALRVGGELPDFELLDHAGNRRRLSELVGEDPTVVHFYRGWWFQGAGFLSPPPSAARRRRGGLLAHHLD
jgi:hypothetical protein